MGSPYTQVHEYMDQKRGPRHREQFGHGKIAEEYIRNNPQQFDEKGWDAFVLHILTDRASDEDKPIDNSTINQIREQYEQIRSGMKKIPYY